MLDTLTVHLALTLHLTFKILAVVLMCQINYMDANNTALGINQAADNLFDDCRVRRPSNCTNSNKYEGDKWAEG